eukprot:scaffold22279_cov123-Isochrysis_galbana.AAC.7
MNAPRLEAPPLSPRKPRLQRCKFAQFGGPPPPIPPCPFGGMARERARNRTIWRCANTWSTMTLFALDLRVVLVFRRKIR